MCFFKSLSSQNNNTKHKYCGNEIYFYCNLAMLNEFLFTKIKEEDIRNIWFHLDGATCRTADATLEVLRPVFQDRIISRRANVVWPPRSCDLTPLDYYLWAAVKDKCYVDNPQTIEGQY